MFACILLGISKIEYKPDAGPGDTLCFKHYNPQEVTASNFIDFYHGPIHDRKGVSPFTAYCLYLNTREKKTEISYIRSAENDMEI